jgi:hypothetical protein
LSKQFRLVATFTEVYEYDVEAESEEEAYYIAKNEIDWSCIGSPDWEDVDFEVIRIDSDSEG